LSTEALYADSEDIRSLARMIRSQGAVEGVEVRMTRADGSTCWTLIAARSISFDGKPAILAGYYDITDRKAAEEALMASEVRYALISRASNDGIWDWDLATGEVFYSSRWKEIIGSATNRRLNRLEDWLSLVHVEDVAELRLRIEEHVSGATPQLDAEYRIRSGEGEYRWMQCRGIVIRDSGGRPIRMAGSQSDITLRKTYEIRLRNAAYRDQLTGMHNRTFFAQELEQLDSPERLGRRALMVCNVDQFRRVNDRFGSAAGDRLLIMVGERLTLLSGPLDLVARIGDDEFVILLGDVSTRADAMALAETILHDLAQPCQLDSALLPVSVSAGLALPSLGAVGGGADLLRNARLALDRSKQNGGGRYTLFDEQLVSEIELRERLSRDLMSAVQGNQIFFDYQPVVALGADGVDRIAGFEALMRWTHPEFGLLHPAQFVPLAEDAGIIGQLGLYAIESAARQIERWSRNGRVPPEFSVAVNLSALQISDPASVKRIYALLDRLALPVGRLKLELTESVMMSDPETMAVVFAGLRDRGVRLSLDDFGTGFSSLSYLHRFPLDTLKIDQSFVTRIGKAPEALRLVRSIIELGHDLGLTIVAEGVEEAGEAEQLRALGCDFAQGYYFSRAVGLEQAEILLARGLLI
jgi:diguanylate cyclase (GGDEF)-like protein/PAS domain S-box-containing protein